MAGACGDCSVCCTVMGVVMDAPEPKKPPRVACAHCKKSGCSIYERRPAPCREFLCLWLASQQMGDDIALSAALRPDRSGVVLEANEAGNVIAHCKQPMAWRREPMRSWLIRMAGRTRVLIEPDNESTLFLHRDGRVEPMSFIGLDPISNCRLYRLELPDDQ